MPASSVGGVNASGLAPASAVSVKASSALKASASGPASAPGTNASSVAVTNASTPGSPPPQPSGRAARRPKDRAAGTRIERAFVMRRRYHGPGSERKRTTNARARGTLRIEVDSGEHPRVGRAFEVPHDASCSLRSGLLVDHPLTRAGLTRAGLARGGLHAQRYRSAGRHRCLHPAGRRWRHAHQRQPPHRARGSGGHAHGRLDADARVSRVPARRLRRGDRRDRVDELELDARGPRHLRGQRLHDGRPRVGARTSSRPTWE
jgi:hypothetical protein